VTDDGLFSIGDLARRTGLTVRTIHFYSDAGVVPESARTPAGYRRYDHEAVTRLDLVRTLRELGLPLDTVQVTQEVEAAIAAGIDPTSAAAAPVVDGLIRGYARAFRKTDTAEFRAAVLQRLEVASDPRAQRYLELLAQINGWGPQPDLTPVVDWFTRALRAHRAPTSAPA
jgi:DNA-binding transcriptional MerR regulator